MGRKIGNRSKSTLDGVKHGGIAKSKQVKLGKQPNITGFLKSQRDPLGELKEDCTTDDNNVISVAPVKEKRQKQTTVKEEMARLDMVMGRVDFQYWVRGSKPLGVKQRSFVFSGTKVTW